MAVLKSYIILLQVVGMFRKCSILVTMEDNCSFYFHVPIKHTMKSLTIPMLALLLGTASCYDGTPWRGIEGQGPVVERKINLDQIKGIIVPGSAKILLTQGDHQEVRIEGQENIIDNINTTVTGEVWRIDNKRPVWRCETIKIYITMEQLRMIRISGSGDVITTNHFNDLKDLEIKVSGSGDLDLDMEADDIFTRVSGSGDITLRGKADRRNP